MSAGWVDSHCHLDSERFGADRDAVVERALEAGVSTMLTIGTGDGPPDIEAAIRIAERYPCVLATVGVHPHDAAKASPEVLRRVEALLRHPRAAGLGEIGLDYHYEHSPRDTQRAVFRDQLAIARAAGRPVIIHTREAWPDTFAILEEHWTPAGLPAVMHCFTGGPEEAARAVRMGCYVSFAGIVTYRKAPEVQAAAREVPADRLLVETDAPFLAPVPHRGKRNEPAYVAITGAHLAALRGEAPESVAAVTAANFRRLFADGRGH